MARWDGYTAGSSPRCFSWYYSWSNSSCYQEHPTIFQVFRPFSWSLKERLKIWNCMLPLIRQKTWQTGNFVWDSWYFDPQKLSVFVRVTQYQFLNVILYSTCLLLYVSDKQTSSSWLVQLFKAKCEDYVYLLWPIS